MTTRLFNLRMGPNGRGLRIVMFLFIAVSVAFTELAMAVPITQRVSLDSSGIEIPEGGRSASISADGRFVAFVSRVPDPVTGTIKAQVFVRDRGTGTSPTPFTRLISVAPDGRPGNDDSSSPTISSDGNVVAFVSKAKNLLAGGTGAADHVFVRDHAAGTTELISNGADGHQGNSFSGSPFISGNGRVVVFQSAATNLLPTPTFGVQVFAYDRTLNRMNLVSATPGTSAIALSTPGNGDSFAPTVNEDGHYVAFASAATNLLSAGATPGRQYFVRDQIARTTELVGAAVSGPQAGSLPDNAIERPSISADGRFVAFTRLITPQSGPGIAGFALSVRDRLTGNSQVVTNGSATSGSSPSMSRDARFLAFFSGTTNLVAGDTNGTADIFLRDLLTGTTERISVASNGAQVFGSSLIPAVSGDGRFVAFESEAPTLVAGDFNHAADVFVRDRAPPPLPTLAINDVSGSEGNSGTHPHTFTVTLSQASNRAVEVNFWTDSGPGPGFTGKATPSSDYNSASGRLRFNPGGPLTQAIQVNIIGDNAVELAETFVVNLDVPDGAVIGKGVGIGTIGNDDAFTPPGVGTFDLAPAAASIEENERITYTLTWTVPPPLNWHDLDNIELRFSDKEGVALWLRFDETDGTLALLNGVGGKAGKPRELGHHGKLESDNATVNLRESSFRGSGPTGPSVTLTLDLSFKHRAAERTFLVEVLASTDDGEQQIEEAGTLTIAEKTRKK